MNIQKQVSGDHSTNVQAAGDVYIGIDEEKLEAILDRVISPKSENNLEIISLIESGKLSQAQDKIDKLIETKMSALAEELVDLATLQSLINTEKSTAILESVIKLSPNKPSVLNAYALALMDKGRVEEAEKSFIQAIEISSDDELKEKAIGNLGVLYKNSGKYKEAADNLEKAIELAKNLNNKVGLIKHSNNLGACYHSTERLDDSITILQESLINLSKLVESESNRKKRKISNQYRPVYSQIYQ
ncbi:tetratricopeptide repeat protein [Vibrio cholerae]|uniref:tetratricopeptide repeat protein n=1 Tax=Vibrio cholerae TaxID=666 RepID=UPI00166AC2BB|nr:tetratricopeptide repeat protein [Vibrio cholerae]GFK56682.1 hypothetical protein VcPa07_03621 [Vibrio cholerae]GFK60238.1 hypothetical protein VcPa08_03636 [Vibrio cholerae]GFK63773.1 hypothetical protein VcPa09_03620 [Vibrio cholerae]GFK67327.1 hypothetical protein VcPa10_03627 [Vibrio cholerae]GFK70872.1 hypothetical protein VcPa11_03626 [Vibrio cholerae]